MHQSGPDHGLAIGNDLESIWQFRDAILAVKPSIMGRVKHKKPSLTDVKAHPPDDMGDKLNLLPPENTGALVPSDDSPVESKLNLLQRFYDKLKLLILFNEKVDSLLSSEMQSTTHVIAIQK